MACFSSCAAIHKTKLYSRSEQTRIDTSSKEHKFRWRIITEEKGTVPITIDTGMVETSGSISAEDTTTHEQAVETDNMSLITTIKPRVKDGRVTGYQVNSKAITKERVINVPIDRKITATGTDINKEQTGISDTKKETTTTITKVIDRIGPWGAVVIVGVITLFLLFVFFKLWK